MANKLTGSYSPIRLVQHFAETGRGYESCCTRPLFSETKATTNFRCNEALKGNQMSNKVTIRLQIAEETHDDTIKVYTGNKIKGKREIITLNRDCVVNDGQQTERELESLRTHHDKCRNVLQTALDNPVHNASADVWENYARLIQQLKNDKSDLILQLSAVVSEVMSIDKISKLGAQDPTLKEEDIRKILGHLQRRITLTKLPQKGKQIAERIEKLEQALVDMLDLSWELSVQKKMCDHRQINAMHILPSNKLVNTPWSK